MKGRIYDPTLGRFLQADPHIQAPTNSQNYNRYSYVLNNPMSYTDPSGYFFKSLKKFVKKYWRTALAIVVSVYMPGMSAFANWSAAATGAVTGFVAGGIATGSLRGALVGAFTGGMFGQLHSMTSGFGKVVAHGITGGMGSVLNGGKFGHGFVSAGFTQALGNVKGLFVEGATQIADRMSNAIKAAVIGGTASVITGGKFASGAITGAFSRLLNDDAVGKAHEAFMKKTGVSKKQLNALLELGDSVYKLHEGLENKLAFENMIGDMNNKQLISLSKALGVSQGEINMVNAYGGDNSLRANLFRKYRATHFFDSLSNAANAAKAAQNVIYIDPAVKHLPKWLAHAYNANSHFEYLQSLKGN